MKRIFFISVLVVFLNSSFAYSENQFGSETLPGFYASQSSRNGAYFWEADSTDVYTVGTDNRWPDQLIDASFSSDGTFYGTGRYSRDLFKVDPMTGQSSVVSNQYDYWGLGIDSQNRAYTGINDNLCEVDLATGSIVRSIGGLLRPYEAFAFDSQGHLFALYHTYGREAYLSELSLSDGQVLATLTYGMIESSHYAMGFCFDEDDNPIILAGNINVGDAPLVYKGDPQTLQLTRLMRLAPKYTGDYSWAVDYYTPEPATILLMSAGGLLLFRRKRK